MLAFADSDTPDIGFTLDSFVDNNGTWHAVEIIKSQKDALEATAIPTAGISVGSLNYIYYEDFQRLRKRAETSSAPTKMPPL